MEIRSRTEASTRFARLEARTPADRNRVVDLVRVLALCVVVLGHWVMQGLYVVETDGAMGLRRQGLLQIAPWTHPLTWVLQVMPLFFLVGGYVNLRSWRSAETSGLGYGTWLAGRTRRLVTPVVPLLVFWAVVLPFAELLGPDDRWLRIATLMSWVPTWFLGVYLVVVALTPLTGRLWRRTGAWSVAGGLGAAGLVDLVSLRIGGDLGFAVAGVNLLLVWLVLHQVGYGWLDGVLRGARAGSLLLVGGLVGALALVHWGPYAVSMVGVSGFGVDNSGPPRVTLLLVGLGQAGAVLLLERALARAAARPRVWFAVAVTGSRLMTIYLWHLTAFGIVAAFVLWSSGSGLPGLTLEPRPATAEWWWARPSWFLVLALSTAVLVRLLGRYEVADKPAGPVAVGWPVLEIVAVVCLVSLLAGAGLVGDDGSRWWWPCLGALLLVVIRRASVREHLTREGRVRPDA